MILGMQYVWNMHASCVSKIHPFSGTAKQDMETLMKRDAVPFRIFAFWGVISLVFPSFDCGRGHCLLVRLLTLVGP